MIDALNTGLVDFSGDLDDLEWYYSVFEPLTFNSETIPG